MPEESLEERQASFLATVRELVDKILGSSEEREEVEHFIDHNEIGEALVYLAWIIADSDRRISSADYEAILRLSAGLIDRNHLPRDLSNHVQTDS